MLKSIIDEQPFNLAKLGFVFQDCLGCKNMQWL